MSIVHYAYISKTKNRDIESILDEPKLIISIVNLTMKKDA